MKSLTAKCLAALLLCLLPWSVQARLEAPDHIIYGSVTIFGTPAAMGLEISARTLVDSEPVATYVLGRFPNLGTQFSLRFPMDTVEPRVPGRVRPGDPIRIFIGTQLAAETVVGAEGVAVRLDLDPQNLGTGPSIRIDGVSAFEGNSGTTDFEFPLFVQSTGDDWDSPAVVHWSTGDESAQGGASCAGGVDYIAASGTVSIDPAPVDPDTQVGSVVVQVCGDTEIEPDETFLVVITSCDFCVPVEPFASGVIIDDDDVPELRVADIYVSKPESAPIQTQFVATLSRNSEHPASFSYQTADGSALAGVHYVAGSGQVDFAAGEVEKAITIDILPHPDIESERFFSLLLSAPSGLSLEREQAIAIIIDPRFEPVVDPGGENGGGPGDIPGLVNPSAIAIAPGDRDTYVVSESGDTLFHLERDAVSGALTLVQAYTGVQAGMEDARLDGPRALAISADGAHVYVAARLDGAVNAFARDGVDGSLTLVGTVFQGQTTTAGTVSGLEGVTAIALAPDGRHLYAAGANANGVAVFARDSVTGGLEFVHALLNGVAGLQFLERPSGVAVTADGTQVLVTARNSSALHVFARETDDGSADFGRLTPQAVHRNGQQGVQGLSGAFGVVLSADDMHVYVAAEASNSVVRFTRSPGDGALTWVGFVAKGQGIPGLGGPLALMVSMDQRHLFVPGFEDNSFSIFERGGDGSLSLRQTLLPGQAGLENMVGPMALDLSEDGRFIYVAANVGNAIVRLRIRLEDPIFSDGFETLSVPDQ